MKTIVPLTFDIAFEIKDPEGLDPIRVMIQEFGGGQGRIIIECYGRAWSCFWPAMGSTMARFFQDCDVDYLVRALVARGKVPKHEASYLRKIVIAVREGLKQYEVFRQKEPMEL